MEASLSQNLNESLGDAKPKNPLLVELKRKAWIFFWCLYFQPCFYSVHMQRLKLLLDKIMLNFSAHKEPVIWNNDPNV